MAETPTCPRCGYDQRGVIDSWENSCPMTGVCSECGLTFEWADVLGARAERLPGFFEHAKGFWRSLWWAWRTWLWAMIPNRFWSRVRMHHRIVPRRIWLWLVLMLLPLHAIGALAATASVWVPFAKGFSQHNGALWVQTIGAWLSPLIRIWPREDGGIFGGWSASIQQFGVTNWPMAASVGLGVWLVITLIFMLLTDTRRVYKVRLSHTLRVSIYGLAWLIPVFALYTLYTVSMSTEFIWAWLDGTAFDFGRESGIFARMAYWIRGFAHRSEYLLLAGVLGWIAWWWWMALSRGLQIDQAGRIWCLLMVPAAFATAAFATQLFVIRMDSPSWQW